MSKFLAAIINALNHDVSIERTLSPTEKLQKLIQSYRSSEKKLKDWEEEM